MDKSPCLDCDYKYENKNSERCMNCRDRLQYVGEIGDMTHSLPMDKTDLGKGGNVDNSDNAKFEPDGREIGMKTCTHCLESKSLDADHFYRQKGGKDGFNSQCIKCLRKKHKDYQLKKKGKSKRSSSDQTKGYMKAVRENPKPDAYMAKDLVNTFRSLFYYDDIQKHTVLVLPGIRYIGKTNHWDTNSGAIYYFEVGVADMKLPARLCFGNKEKAVNARNELLIQIERFYSKGD